MRCGVVIIVVSCGRACFGSLLQDCVQPVLLIAGAAYFSVLLRSRHVTQVAHDVYHYAVFGACMFVCASMGIIRKA